MKRGEPSKWSYCKEGGTFGGCSLPSIAGVSYPPSPTNPGLANPPSCRPTYPPSLPPHSLSRRPSASSSRRRILKHRRSLFAPPPPPLPRFTRAFSVRAAALPDLLHSECDFEGGMGVGVGGRQRRRRDGGGARRAGKGRSGINRAVARFTRIISANIRARSARRSQTILLLLLVLFNGLRKKDTECLLGGGCSLNQLVKSSTAAIRGRNYARVLASH